MLGMNRRRGREREREIESFFYLFIELCNAVLRFILKAGHLERIVEGLENSKVLCHKMGTKLYAEKSESQKGKLDVKSVFVRWEWS
jgi:hypothetical protein